MLTHTLHSDQNKYQTLKTYLKGVTAKTSPIEISPSKIAINSTLVDFFISNVEANILGQK